MQNQSEEEKRGNSLARLRGNILSPSPREAARAHSELDLRTMQSLRSAFGRTFVLKTVHFSPEKGVRPAAVAAYFSSKGGSGNRQDSSSSSSSALLFGGAAAAGLLAAFVFNKDKLGTLSAKTATLSSNDAKLASTEVGVTEV